MTVSTTAPRLRATLWMLGGVVAFSLMALAGREAGVHHDTFEILFYRSLTGLALILVWIAATGQAGRIGHGRMGLMAARNLFHFAGQNLWLHALTVLPLAQVFALEFTTPVWVLLLAPLLLGEAITRRGAGVAALGFAGILIVTRPWSGPPDPGLWAAALAAVGFAVSAITTRLLTRTDTVLSVLFWMHVMQALFALAAALIDGTLAAPSAASLPTLLAVGVLGLVAQICLTSALSLAPAAAVMPVDFLRLPLIVVLGAALYGEGADAAVILGGAVILLANWLNLRDSRPDATGSLPPGPQTP